jgi:DNA repair photolyase
MSAPSFLDYTSPRLDRRRFQDDIRVGEKKAKMVLRPGVPAPNLAPRMGKEVLRERSGVRYHELQSRTLLNRCTSVRMPFRWTVNPYRGCAMGCRYCYATYTHEFMGMATPESFHSVVYVKAGAEAETARQLPSIVGRGELIALGAATDPYQPGETDLKVTRRFLEIVARHRNVRLGITTKGAVILRDLDLLRKIHERSSLGIHVSLISLDENLLRRLEPWAPPPEVRLEVMRRLRESGLEVGISVAPVLPALTDSEADLDALLGRTADAGVRRMAWNILFLRSPTREKYLRWVAEEFPRYHEAYTRAYTGRVYLGGRYRERIREIMERLRQKHALTAEFGAGGGTRFGSARQLRLWM